MVFRNKLQRLGLAQSVSRARKGPAASWPRWPGCLEVLFPVVPDSTNSVISTSCLSSLAPQSAVLEDKEQCYT